MLLALDVLRETAQQFLQIVVEVLFESVDHAEVVVLLDRFLDVFALEEDLLLSSSYCVNQVRVVLVQIIVELILVDDVLIFSDEEVDLGASVILVAFAGA